MYTPNHSLDFCIKFDLTIIHYMLINKLFDIGPVICPRPMAAGQNDCPEDKYTGPISNHLFIDNFI